MNLTEKNYVLAFALDDINYIVTENAGNNPGDVKKQYDYNKAAFDQIAKILANAMRLDIIGDDLPEGTYFTPEAARKFAEEQSKKDEGLSFEDAPNLNDVLRNPPFKGGAEEEARERFGKFLSIPALGMQFRRYRSANTTILVATWRDDFNSHVYVLRVERDGDSPNCGWRATATNDGHAVFQLRTKNRSNCEQFAFSAMKRYLKRGHRRTYRTIAKAKKEEK
jgi:hypothetical protein